MGTTGGELLVACLAAQGVRRIFGVPGESYLAVLDALHDSDPHIAFINARNEGGASFMAEAHGKLTGQPGIAFVTRGPGATNASIGLHAAMQASTPMILFIGQIPQDVRGREAFQEVDYRAFFGPIVKWAVEIESADRIPEIIARAFVTARSGRPGPVVVALPEDVLSAQTDARAGAGVRIAEAGLSPDLCDEITRRLEAAARPLILVGGGGWTKDGRAALARFARRTGAPIAAAFRFNDLYDNRAANYVGEAGIAMAPQVSAMIRDADLILAAGIRFGEMTTGDYTLFASPDPQQFLIHAHASDREIGKIYQPQLPVHCGPNMLFESLAVAATPLASMQPGWVENARDAYVQALACPAQPGAVDMGVIMAHLREVLPDDVIVTTGAGNFATWPNRFLPLAETARLLGPQSGAMGYGLPAAISAKLAEPEKTVLCFTGDGDFQMNCQELATARQFGSAPIVLLLNNGTYGTIRMHQERNFPGRVSATDLTNPDFAQLAQIYGLHGEKVTRTEQFAEAFARAKAAPHGAVLELMIDQEALTPRQTLSQMRQAALEKQAAETV